LLGFSPIGPLIQNFLVHFVGHHRVDKNVKHFNLVQLKTEQLISGNSWGRALLRHMVRGTQVLPLHPCHSSPRLIRTRPGFRLYHHSNMERLLTGDLGYC